MEAAAGNFGDFLSSWPLRFPCQVLFSVPRNHLLLMHQFYYTRSVAEV